MKNLVNAKPQLTTRVIHLIPLLLIYTIGLSIAHILASESGIPLAHIGKQKLIGHSVPAVRKSNLFTISCSVLPGPMRPGHWLQHGSRCLTSCSKMYPIRYTH